MSDLHCLPVINDYSSFFISNSDPHYKIGSHWMCFYAISSKKFEFFDSFGRAPYILSHLKYLKNKTVSYNDKCIQHPLSLNCGLYCIYYMIMKHKGLSLGDIQSIFSNDLIANDYYIESIFL